VTASRETYQSLIIICSWYF